MVYFKTRKLAIGRYGRALRPCGNQGFIVPAGKGDGVGGDDAAFLPVLQGIAGFRGAVAMKADDGLPTGRQLGIAVEDDQFVPGVRGIVSGLGALVVFEVEGEAFFAEQAAQEIEVGFPVLRDEAIGTQGLGNLVGPVDFRVIGKHLADEIEAGAVLEQVAITALAEESEEGLHDQAVTRQAAIGAKLGALGDVAMPGADAAVGLAQLERNLLAE